MKTESANRSKAGGALKLQLGSDMALVMQHHDKGVGTFLAEHRVRPKRTCTSMLPAAARAVGVISISSVPNNPSSPARGLGPLTRIFGAASQLFSDASVTRMTRSTLRRYQRLPPHAHAGGVDDAVRRAIIR
jgi:hypothetical protein